LLEKLVIGVFSVFSNTLFEIKKDGKVV